MSLRFTILGCGSSGGVPRIGPDWGACDPSNPKNRRRRCSLLVERLGPAGTTRILVDTSPDMREQLLGADVGALDAVLITHEHADHTHGLDDLRQLALRNGRRVPIHMDEITAALITERFSYCFRTSPGGVYPAIVDDVRLHAGRAVAIDGAGGRIVASPFDQVHGEIGALGYRFGGLAYSSDVNDFPAASLGMLENLDVWILDALRYRTHPSHFTVAEALAWIDKMKPRRAILTNMHVDLDYEALRRELPEGVEPAYDGLTITLNDDEADRAP